MAEVLNLADARQLYANSLLMYKGKPSFVLNINADFNARIRDLASGREHTVAFNTNDFKAVGNRLGFVNINCSAVFIFRKPVRLYSVGITQNNLGTSYSRDCFMGGNANTVVGLISTLQVNSLVDTIEGIYPEFGEAYQLAKDFEGSYAFDRQFSVDCRSNIFYKNNWVGVATGKTIDKIVFNNGYEYLNLILGNIDEKDPRQFRPN